MDYQVSARKWRPQTFEEVVGQTHVARTLTNAIRQGRIAHAYLFSGMRGVGKTTMARILAKSLNCETAVKGPTVAPCQDCPSCRAITGGQSPDVVEIDGASNRGIDEVRELREVLKYAPMAGKYRIYIIDEIHMLTKEAFNALLKTLEEPPSHVIFIFATTEDHKIPSTILSRCQHFRFKRITRQEIIAQLERIIREEGVRISGPGLGMIAKAADGSLRDALSFLDQGVAYGGKEVSDQDLQVILGAAGRELLMSMVMAILRRQTSEALRRVKELADQGMDYRQFTGELLEYLRHLVMAKSTAAPEEMIDLSSEEVEEIRQLSSWASLEEMQRLFGVFSMALESFRGAAHPVFVLEMAVIRATQIQPLESFERLLERLQHLERSLQDGSTTSQDTRVPIAGPLEVRAAGPKVQASPTTDPDPKSEVQPPQPGPARVKPIEINSEESGRPGLPLERWGAVVKRLLQERPNVGSYLEKGVVQEWIPGNEKDILVIGYDEGAAVFADFIQKDETQAVIASALREVFGKPVELKVVRRERSAAERTRLKLQHEQQSQLQRKRIQQESMAHPLVKEALNILGGEVIDIKEP
ncbi:MAG TPA: DNA polymerase III subunit gamma/tau [Nitrospiria bacterium]|jgi:DNA polymerase-3 subunit gamma/tau|nr:DNA polymerase III subunit gamma/tau [Nitrospiria bacterium]